MYISEVGYFSLRMQRYENKILSFAPSFSLEAVKSTYLILRRERVFAGNEIWTAFEVQVSSHLLPGIFVISQGFHKEFHWRIQYFSYCRLRQFIQSNTMCSPLPQSLFYFLSCQLWTFFVIHCLSSWMCNIHAAGPGVSQPPCPNGNPSSQRPCLHFLIQ